MEDKIYGLMDKMYAEMQEMKANMVTKDDIKNMATKDDINSLDFRISNIEQTMATKDDIKELKGEINRLDSRIDNIEQTMATKVDVQNLENKIENLLSEQQKYILSILKITHNQIEDKLDNINNEIEFLNHKVYLNEKEIFKLKKNIQITKCCT